MHRFNFLHFDHAKASGQQSRGLSIFPYCPAFIVIAMVIVIIVMIII